MPDNSSPRPSDFPSPAGWAALEARLARLEAHLGLAAAPGSAPAAAAEPPSAATLPVPAAAAAPQQTADDLELEVGQTWFARVGILVFALGGGYMLTLPHPGLPPMAPSLAGLAAAAALLFVAHQGERSFALVASYLRGAGMALLYCATLRFFFFGTQPALAIDSLAGPLLLSLAVAVNLAIALRRRSPWLTGLALVMGYGTVLALGTTWSVLSLLAVLAVLTAFLSLQRRWPAIALVGIFLSSATYLLWAAGNPARGGALHFVPGPPFAPAVVLLCVLIFGALPLFRRSDDTDDAFSIAGALATCAFGYGVYLVHTAAAFPQVFAPAHVGAAAVFTLLAITLWQKQHSRISVFFYAMTGSAALSMAIIKASPSPDVFVWLSLQSVLVVATAIWFRSRSIVVANFVIYVGVVLAYMFAQKSETGISVGIGIVALVSARILNWKKHRLELKTEFMRNAYLLSAFVIFPYALLHLVPDRFVGLAWIGMALVYYVLNFAVRNRKYRWMGHGTLLLTAVYLLLAGGRKLDPTWRITSFLVLGTVMLVASLVFTRLQRRDPGPTKG